MNYNFAVKLAATDSSVMLTVRLHIFNCKIPRSYCKMCRFYS